MINLRQGQLTLELFIKSTAPERPKFPLPEHAGLRHLAFKVDDVETYLAKLDQLGIENTGPVSYTHLDVYKRQVYTRARKASFPI